MSVQRLLGSVLGITLAVSGAASAQAPPRPQPTAVTNVSLDRSGESEERYTLLLRDGRIAGILSADSELPKGHRIVDAEGLLCLPAFVDAYTRTGCETPEPVKDQDMPVSTGSDVRVDMREANRKGIQPAFRAAEALAIEAKASEAWRESGFGAAQIAPGGELLAGTSCLATTREAAMRDVVLEEDVFACGAFRANGPRSYPSTLMGYIAQLRQFFHDAERQAQLEERYDAGRPGLRPPFDAELAAGRAILSGERRLLVEANTHRDVERWIKLADAFGFQIAVQGGRDVWRVADLLAEREIPVVLTLDWGKEVKDPAAKDEKKEKGDEPEEEAEEEAEEEEEATEPEEVEEVEATTEWQYTEPLGVRLERRRKWEEGRDSAIRLHEAGVAIAFGTASEKPGDLLEKVRTLVEEGLPADVALAALTADAAAILGVEGRLGGLAAGHDATLTLWSADPLTDEKATVVWTFVDGFPTEFDKPEEEAAAGGPPAEGVDASGSWALLVENDGETSEAELTVEMAEDGAVTGELVQENPMDQSEMVIELSGQVSGTTMTLSGTFEVGDFSVDFEYELEIDGDELSGELTLRIPAMPEPMVRSVEGQRTPSQF